MTHAQVLIVIKDIGHGQNGSSVCVRATNVAPLLQRHCFAGSSVKNVSQKNAPIVLTRRTVVGRPDTKTSLCIKDNLNGRDLSLKLSELDTESLRLFDTMIEVSDLFLPHALQLLLH